MDLSKVFDIQDQKLLTAKTETYGLDSESFTFSQSYLTERYLEQATLLVNGNV